MNVIQIALKEYGVSAIDGVGSNPRVLKYFADIGESWVTDDDTSWCACFVNWVLLQAGIKGTGNLMARSFLNIGTPTTMPEAGDIVVLWRIAKDSPWGHVGFFISETAHTVFLLAGNTDGRVKIKEYPKNTVLGYRKLYA